MLFESVTQCIDGRIETYVRGILVERRRCGCGLLFWARRPEHVYCARQCKDHAKRQRERVLQEQKRCLCGCLFASHRRWHVYCSVKCRDLAHSLKRRARKVHHMPRNPQPVAPGTSLVGHGKVI